MAVSPVRLMIVALVVFSTVGPAWCIEVPLTFEKPRGRTAYSGLPGKGVYLDEKCPAGEWKLPEFKGPDPRFALMRLGDRVHLLVLDQQSENDGYYTRLYFDANANRDLNDDPPVEANHSSDQGPYKSALFSPIEAQVLVDGKECRSLFSLDVNSYNRGTFDRLWNWMKGSRGRTHARASAYASHKGVFELNGQQYKVALSDGNMNGRLDDTYKKERLARVPERYWPETGDILQISEEGSTAPSYLPFLTNRLVLDGTVFKVIPDPTGAKLVIEPETVETGPVKLNVPFDLASLSAADGSTITVMFPSDSFPLPTGKHSINHYYLSRKDDGDGFWRLKAERGEDTVSLEVAAGTENRWPYGEPFVAGIEAPRLLKESGCRGSSHALMDFTLLGAGKERVADTHRSTGTKSSIAMSNTSEDTPTEPAFKVTKPDGEVVAQGVFRYG